MRKLLLITAIISSSFLSSATINDNEKISYSKDLIEINSIHVYQDNTNDLTKDCTVRLDFELSDGSTIQGELTFVDVTWWECSKMQLAAWWERNF